MNLIAIPPSFVKRQVIMTRYFVITQNPLLKPGINKTSGEISWNIFNFPVDAVEGSK